MHARLFGRPASIPGFLLTSSLLLVVACRENTVAPDNPTSEDIVVTVGPHHLGDNVGVRS
jgi:hypothetical protein